MVWCFASLGKGPNGWLVFGDEREWCTEVLRCCVLWRSDGGSLFSHVDVTFVTVTVRSDHGRTLLVLGVRCLTTVGADTSVRRSVATGAG